MVTAGSAWTLEGENPGAPEQSTGPSGHPRSAYGPLSEDQPPGSEAAPPSTGIMGGTECAVLQVRAGQAQIQQRINENETSKAASSLQRISHF